MIADAESILRVCGMGRTLYIGCGHASVVFELLKRGVDAYGLDKDPSLIETLNLRAPNRFFTGSLTEYPLKGQVFDTILIGGALFDFQPSDFLTVLKALQPILNHNLVLYFTADDLKKIKPIAELSNRLTWEKLAIHAEYRRHPREMLVNTYDSLENETLGTFVFFEKIPDAAKQAFSLEWLLKNRDLHMDMLREAGRRSDGHVVRYVLAAEKIRPGDVVLDAACGLGYGTAVMAACSPGAKFIGVDLDDESMNYATVNYASCNPALQYRTCDVTDLAFIPDHSIDTVISFETIEHVPDYEIFLDEIKRVLKPDGRFIGSVPNLWCDETGNDPNPFHFHVFDWKKLNEAIARRFIVDARWSQIAGGGFTLRDGKRILQPVPLDQPEPKETEWWVISAVANPTQAKQPAYTNPFKGTANTHLVDFASHYDNPWLYRVMVQLGERINDKHALMRFCSEIAQASKMGSADQGAALCVVCYQLLESGNVTHEDVLTLIEFINAYDQAYDKNNPHAYRWAVSLHYVCARLLLLLGKHEEAKATFLTCAEMDPRPFSGLLATKTISSRLYAALLYLASQDKEAAKQQLRLGIKAAQSAVQSDWKHILGDIDQPFPFGLQEAAEVLDIAGQCAQTLHALEKEGSTPGYIWDKVNLKRFGLVEWNKSLERENRELRASLNLA